MDFASQWRQLAEQAESIADDEETALKMLRMAAETPTED